MSEPVTSERVFSLLADRHSINILKMAYSGFRGSSSSYAGNLSKKQFYVRLRRLRDAGFIEKRGSVYRTTTFGSLIVNGHVKTLDEILNNFWNLKAVDVLKAREDFPLHQKESVINDIIQSTTLKQMVNGTHLSGFSVIKDYNRLVIEVIKLLESAQSEVYMATRYFDPHFSKLMYTKIREDNIKMHLLDGLPDQQSVAGRLNAIVRTPPDRQTFEIVTGIMKSDRFELKKANVPASFMVVDGTSVCYETTNYSNPEQFTIAISHYDDRYLAQQFITYYHSLAKNATAPKLLVSIEGK
jgi:hypothetical protein